jgi:hypothetical protein
VAFEDLIVLPNPFPILPLHCTIAGRDHRQQRIAGRVDTLLRLAAAVGPRLAVFYNGPRCGASAPDHFHFQAATAAPIPILSQLPAFTNGQQRIAHTSFGRSMLVLASPSAADVGADIEQTVESLRQLVGGQDEPMFNLIVHRAADRFVAVLFPRRAHRPACYFAEGREYIAVSPAVLEMSGLLVTTDPNHFERIDAESARSIYEQVSLELSIVERLTADSI